jgi:hypothetical protein
MADSAIPCPSGYVSDLASPAGQEWTCKIPLRLLIISAWAAAFVYPAAILFDVFIAFSAEKSFFSRDRESVFIVFMRITTQFTMLSVVLPFAYNGADYSPDSHPQVIMLLGICCVSISNEVLASIYRSLRRGVQFAFALSPNVQRNVQRLNGVEAMHILFVTVCLYRGITELMPTVHRAKALILWDCTAFLPPVAMHLVAASHASKAIDQLPKTEQSREWRVKLEAFRRKNLLRILPLAIFISLSAFAMVFDHFMFTLIFLGHLILHGVGNIIRGVLKFRKQNRKQQRHSKSKGMTVQIQPTNFDPSKTLCEWEAEGVRLQLQKLRLVENGHKSAPPPPPSESIPSDSVQPVIFGVSFAALKSFQAENSLLGEDWTMAEVCAKLIKRKTLFRHADAVADAVADYHCADYHCPYATLLDKARDETGRPFVSKATHFVSYAWSYPWRVVYSAIETLEKRKSDVDRRAPTVGIGTGTGRTGEGGEGGDGRAGHYYFIDQFCLDQNVMTAGVNGLLSKEQMQQEIVVKLQNSIEQPGRVLMLLVCSACCSVATTNGAAAGGVTTNGAVGGVGGVLFALYIQSHLLYTFTILLFAPPLMLLFALACTFLHHVSCVCYVQSPLFTLRSVLALAAASVEHAACTQPCLVSFRDLHRDRSEGSS